MRSPSNTNQLYMPRLELPVRSINHWFQRVIACRVRHCELRIGLDTDWDCRFLHIDRPCCAWLREACGSYRREMLGNLIGIRLSDVECHENSPMLENGLEVLLR